MKPLYIDEICTIFQGDALSILRELQADSIDAVITDPPYCSGAAGLSGKQADPASKYQQTGTKKTYPAMLGDCRDQRSFTLWMTLWLSECWRIAKRPEHPCWYSPTGGNSLALWMPHRRRALDIEG